MDPYSNPYKTHYNRTFQFSFPFLHSQLAKGQGVVSEGSKGGMKEGGV